jgi:hypothetical protein
MFSGRVKAQVIDVAGVLGQVHELEARQDYDSLLKLAARQPVTQETICKNQIFHGMAGWLFWQCFNGMSQPYAYTQYAGSFIQQWYLANYNVEPVWSEDFANQYIYFLTSGNYNPPNYVTAYHHKSSGQEIQAHTIYSESYSSGKRAIYRTWRFLWLTGECNSSEIRGMVFGAWRDNNDYAGTNRETYWRASGRVRFKDSNGVPITLLKNSSKLLLIEYTMRLMSL